MKGENTMIEQLMNEFEELRQRTAEFQHSEAERKRSEKVLRDSAEKCRRLVEDMPALVCRFMLDGTLTFVNSSYCEYFNKNSEDLIGENFFQFIPEEDREKVRNHFQSLTHERPIVTYEHQVITPNGEIRWQRWTDRALFDRQGNLLEYQSIGFDITEHRRAEEAIKRRFEFERIVSTISSRFINASDIDNTINTSLADIGRACGVSRTYLFLFHQDEAGMDNTHEWCAEGVSPQIDNLQNLPCEMLPWWMSKLRNEGVIHIRDVSKMPTEAKAEKEILKNQDIKSLLVLPIYVRRELAGFIGFDNVMETGEWHDDDLALLRTSSDIIGNALERKRSEQALRESESKFRTLFDLSPQPVCLIEFETGRFIEVNDKLCELTKYTREELLGRTSTECRLHSRRNIKEFLKELKGSEEVHGLEMDFRAKDGSIINTLVFSKLVRIAGESFILIMFVDLTDRKRLEAQLLQAQKMEAIGTLAGAIAHDFNNVLMGIQGHASLALLYAESNRPHSEHIKAIEDMVKRGADLAKQLLGFARGGKYEVKPADLNAIIKKSSELFGRTRIEIKIHRKYQKDIWLVEVDRGQIEQVLLNVYVNAWHAMPSGGDLYVETSHVVLDDKFTKAFGVESGNYVKISITDTGVGMDEATRQKIFDPFFTTKEMGRGTGLGLASVYGIIKNHDGIINVYSEKGKGSTFEIYLPASEKEAPISEKEVTTKEERVIDDIFKGTETVLLVDDEDMILDVGAGMLREMGYNVLLAGNAKEALQVYRKHKDHINLVILDMIMPDIGGGDVYDRLKELQPHIKVLLSTGYSISGQATEILERGCDGLIEKPFNMKELSKKIREILD